MQPDSVVPSNGRRSPAAPVDEAAELAALRATCRRQERTISALGASMSALHRRATALTAENADLRAAIGPVRHRGRIGVRELLDVHLPLDERAPAAARMIVAARLQGRVAPPVLENAGLIVTELVTNGVRHGGISGIGVVAVGVLLTSHEVVIEVEDPGYGGPVTVRTPDLDGGGGFGLNVVQTLSERWGFERVAAGGTRVWAEFSRGRQYEPVAPSGRFNGNGSRREHGAPR